MIEFFFFLFLKSSILLFIYFLLYNIVLVLPYINMNPPWGSLLQFSPVSQSCPTPCDPMDCSMPGFPVYHQRPELAQTHVHWVGDSIQPAYLLSSPSHPAINLSQHESFPVSQFFTTGGQSQFFTTGGQSIGASALASVLPMNTQDWSPLGWTGCISLQSKRLSRVFSNTTVQKHQFFGTQLSL